MRHISHIFARRFQTVFLAVSAMACPVSAFANDVEQVVIEFEKNCIANSEHVEGGWYQVSKEYDPSLDTYYANIANLLGDQIDSQSHFAKFINDRPVFLSRYRYTGQFGTTSNVCMISDFSRDSWKFPQGLETYLENKTIKTDHSVTIVENEKSVGHWRAHESMKPVSMITASAFGKDGPDHTASQFYGLQLTATRLEITEEITIN